MGSKANHSSQSVLYPKNVPFAAIISGNDDGCHDFRPCHEHNVGVCACMCVCVCVVPP